MILIASSFCCTCLSVFRGDCAGVEILDTGKFLVVTWFHVVVKEPDPLTNTPQQKLSKKKNNLHIPRKHFWVLVKIEQKRKYFQSNTVSCAPKALASARYLLHVRWDAGRTPGRPVRPPGPVRVPTEPFLTIRARGRGPASESKKSIGWKAWALTSRPHGVVINWLRLTGRGSRGWPRWGWVLSALKSVIAQPDNLKCWSSWTSPLVCLWPMIPSSLW